MYLHLGDSLEIVKTFKDNSVDACVTDPPYGLAFMGKRWDYDVPSVELWREVFRVMKPGAHLLSFGGTRTYHRMVVAIEDAGFEIRDQVQWIYGSGFPKSLDVSKAIDKAAGVEREVIGRDPLAYRANAIRNNTNDTHNAGFKPEGSGLITAPATPDAKAWQGWGTALKPANEPIVLARKPLERGLTVAQNVLKWGTGAINVDASRIGANPGYSYPNGPVGNSFSVAKGADGTRTAPVESTQGRWPANVLFDEDAASVLDAQSGDRKGFSDGGTSRFFYVAKASKRERNAGLEGMPERVNGFQKNGEGTTRLANKTEREAGLTHAEISPRANHHPTVKPIKLMEYLVCMITPPGGVVLDPFMGSGTTGCAAVNLGFEFVGVEREPEYLEIAKRRINNQELQRASN